MQIFSVLLLVGAVTAFPGGDHHGDGHDDQCVDISKYSDILYKETTAAVCSYKTRRVCQQRSNTACVGIPITTCEAKAYADCHSEPFVIKMQDDSTESLEFVGKECLVSGQQTLVEYQQVPVCKNVTKEHCESKWVINAAGEKVWAGNENCKEVTWEDCQLENVPQPVNVDTYTCRDMAPIYYTQPTIVEVDVTGYKTTCKAAAYADCSVSYVQECAPLEYEECTDIIEPVCFGEEGAGITFRVPYQTYDHRLKCIQ